MVSQKMGNIVPPGQLVDIGGFCLHALVLGEGAPTVLLEPALGGFALQYAHIQSAASAFTRVVAYDRAGQGWSDASPNPRTPDHLADELRTLLGSLNLQPPYLLVGHSFGGLLVRIYAGFHPEEVAGVILVDSSDVAMYDSFPDLDKNVSQMATMIRLQKFAGRLGLGKLLAKLSLGSTAWSLPKEDLDIFLELASRPRHLETTLAEFSQHRSYFGPESVVPRSLGDKPLVVVTAGNSVSGKGKVGNLTGDQMNARHQIWQKELLQLSSQSEQVIVSGATHLSLLTQPEDADQVVDAIRRMVARLRKLNLYLGLPGK